MCFYQILLGIWTADPSSQMQNLSRRDILLESWPLTSYGGPLGQIFHMSMKIISTGTKVQNKALFIDLSTNSL